MDTCKKAEQVKEQIMKELFSDISTNLYKSKKFFVEHDKCHIQMGSR